MIYYESSFEKEMGLTQGNAQQKIKTAEDLQPC